MQADMRTFSPPRETPEFQEYIHLVYRHHQCLETEDRAGDQDEIEQRMSELWPFLDAAQQRSVKGYASDLNWIRRDFQLAPRSHSAESVTERDLEQLNERLKAKDWHAALHWLRVCAPCLLQDRLIAIRSVAYDRLEWPNPLLDGSNLLKHPGLPTTPVAIPLANAP